MIVIADLLAQWRILPVLTLEDADDAVAVAQALVAGGLPALEVTLRTATALDCIGAIARAVPEAIVGAGTVTEPGDIARARDAGARFALSPGFLPDLVAAARDGAMPYMPAVATPSEAMAAARLGHNLLKFFPAAALGGAETLKAWAAPLPAIRFCPTGGVGPANLAAWLALPNVVAVGGSWFVTRDDLANRDWRGIEIKARDAVALAG